MNLWRAATTDTSLVTLKGTRGQTDNEALQIPPRYAVTRHLYLLSQIERRRMGGKRKTGHTLGILYHER